jgi:hypothetical protein
VPIASVLSFVKQQLAGIPMPGPNALAMKAYITPPDPNVDAQIPTAYVWPTDGTESRDTGKGGSSPRNTGPGTPAGWKPIEHVVDVFIVYFMADDDPQADSLFPGIVDAAMYALRTCQDSATLADPYNPNITSTLYDLGENLHYQIVISALADQAYNRYDALIRCSCYELIQA